MCHAKIGNDFNNVYVSTYKILNIVPLPTFNSFKLKVGCVGAVRNVNLDYFTKIQFS